MKQLLKTALQSASVTQNLYDTLGAPTTQNVRNPQPLHLLIGSVLNKLPTLSFVAFEGKQIVTFKGKTKEVSGRFYVDAEEFFGKNYRTKLTFTVREIIALLRQKGYIINCEQSVQQVMSAGKIPGLAYFSGTKPKGKMGYPPRRYYIADNEPNIL